MTDLERALSHLATIMEAESGRAIGHASRAAIKPGFDEINISVVRRFSDRLVAALAAVDEARSPLKIAAE